LLTFVNADVIAQGLAGFDPESAALEAGRIMLDRLHDLAARRGRFAFEETPARRSYTPWRGGRRPAGDFVCLGYVLFEGADVAVARVAQRVRHGGHHVPEATIRQRYRRGLRNFFQLYRPIAALWRVYDNTLGGPYRLVAEGGSGQEFIADPDVWQRMMSR